MTPYVAQAPRPLPLTALAPTTDTGSIDARVRTVGPRVERRGEGTVVDPALHAVSGLSAVANNELVDANGMTSVVTQVHVQEK